MADHGVYPKEFAERIANSAGLRNILVHDYYDVDRRIVHASIRTCLQDYHRYLEHVGSFLRGLAPRQAGGGSGAQPGRTGGKKAAKPKKKAAKRKVAPKYKDPQSGAPWSGRGLPPKWLAEKEKAGAKREEFLIKRK